MIYLVCLVCVRVLQIMMIVIKYLTFYFLAKHCADFVKKTKQHFLSSFNSYIKIWFFSEISIVLEKYIKQIKQEQHSLNFNQPYTSHNWLAICWIKCLIKWINPVIIFIVSQWHANWFDCSLTQRRAELCYKKYSSRYWQLVLVDC